MIVNRKTSTAAINGLSFGLMVVIAGAFASFANAQIDSSPSPSNSLRRGSVEANDSPQCLRSETNHSSLFSSKCLPAIDFKLHSGLIVESIVTEEQLADIAYGYPQRENSPNSSKTDVIYDPSVRLAGHNAAAIPGFSAFSDVAVAAFDAPVDALKGADEPILAEAMPDPGAASPQPLPQPQQAQALIGPAYPADLAVETPISRQMIGELLEGIQRHKSLLGSTNENGDEEHSRRSRLLDESLNLLLSAKKYFKKDLIQSNSIKTFEADKKILQEKLSIDRKPQTPWTIKRLTICSRDWTACERKWKR